MRVLVSVRSAAEVHAVLEGGGEIVDAKEPARGPLGAVDPDVMREIAAAVPPDLPLSAALGDCVATAAAAAAVAAVPTLGPRGGPTFFKLGLAGLSDPERIEEVLAAAVDAAQARPDRVEVVAATYADHRSAGTADPLVVLDAAANAGARGVLVDTWGKNGPDLLDWMPRSRLDEWVARGRARGLLTAVAGSLRGGRLLLAAGSGADVAGVRGAVCEGGRNGTVSALLVRRTRRLLSGVPAPLVSM